MNFLYNKQIAAVIAALAISGSACGQHSKVKTITIVNGDTTLSETNMDEKTLSQIEKEMNITISDDGKADKKIVKKVIIKSDGDEKDAKGMAYAYSFGEDQDQDIEVITDGADGDTKIIIKKSGGEKDEKSEKKVLKKSVSGTSPANENLKLNINVKNTTATLEVESSSKEPLNISILDENGKQVFYDSQKSGEKYSREIPLGKKGTYFLNLIQNKKSTSEKIIVE